MDKSESKAVQAAQSFVEANGAESGSVLCLKRAYKRRDPSFLKVYINHKQHFKLLSVYFMGESNRRSQSVVSDDTLRVAKVCGLRLTKDQEWIIGVDADTINHALSKLLGRTVALGRVY